MSGKRFATAKKNSTFVVNIMTILGYDKQRNS